MRTRACTCVLTNAEHMQHRQKYAHTRFLKAWACEDSEQRGERPRGQDSPSLSGQGLGEQGEGGEQRGLGEGVGSIAGGARWPWGRPGLQSPGEPGGGAGTCSAAGRPPPAPLLAPLCRLGGQSQGAAGRVPALQTGLRPSSSHSPTHSLSSRRPLGLAHWRCPLPLWALTVSSSVHWTPAYLSSRAWQPCPLAQSRLLRQGTTRLMPLPLGPGDPSAPPGQPQQR